MWARLFIHNKQTVHFQSNTIPERGTIYDFCFEKKASGQWIDWMDTLEKGSLNVAADAKVGLSCMGLAEQCL